MVEEKPTNLNQTEIDNLPYAVILTAIQEEFRAVCSFLTSTSRVKHPNGTIYRQGVFGEGRQAWRIAVCEIGAGNMGAAVEAERAIAFFHPKVLAFVGVAGGLKDVRIGDVVAATKVYGYEAGKAKRQFQTRPEVFRSSYELEHEARAAASENIWSKRLKDKPEEPPFAFVGPIAAGEKVVASTYSDAWKLIRNAYSDALAVEMEGAGTLKAAHANQHVKTIIIRGISDLVDNKEDADASGSQKVAAERASAFMFEILANLRSDSTLIHSAIPPQPSSTIAFPTDNIFFTGRDDVLNAIRDLLHQGRRVALYGMPGIGKTQIAIRFAHQFQSDYSYIFWINADNTNAVISGYVAMAQHILPQITSEMDQSAIIDAVKKWLTINSNWLIVFDNADKLDLMRDYLPTAKSGHVIITTVQSTFGSIADGIEVVDLSNPSCDL